MRKFFVWWLLAGSFSAGGEEFKFDFGEFLGTQIPTNFHSVVVGKGKPGEWKVLQDEVPSLMAPLTAPASELSPQRRSVTSRAVLAQVSQDPTDERFPLLIYDSTAFGD